MIQGKIMEKKNWNSLKLILNNMKNLSELKLKDLNDQIEEFKDKLLSKAFSIKEYIEYLNEKYNYPVEIYEHANIEYKGERLPERPVLVLSGGGARGMAHAGVFKVLNDLKINPVAIIGTSIGAVAGSLIADGKTAIDIYDIMYINEDMFRTLKWTNPLVRKKVKDKLTKFLKKHIDAHNFEELKIPLYINSADLKTCNRIIFKSGELVSAVVGSAAIPFMIESVKRDNFLLTDGGVLDNFCVDIAHNIDNDGIIIIDVSGSTDQTSSVLRDHRLLQFSKDIIETSKSFGQRILPIESEKDVYSFINNIFYMLKLRGGLAPTLKGGEILITPNLNGMKVFDFDRRDFAYQKGIEAAKSVFKKFL